MPPPMTGMRTGTALGTAAGGGGATAFGGIQEGKFTEKVYGYIRDQKYGEAIAVLSTKVLEFPNNRAAISLLAYCYYHSGDFQNAIGLYERLTKMVPENDEYKFHYAQSLFKAGLYEPAVKACQSVSDTPGLALKVQLLQAAIKYEQDDLMNTKAFIEQCPQDEADTAVNHACVLYKEATQPDADPALFEQARMRFQEAMNAMGFTAEIAYAIGLCYYQQKQYGPALKHIAEIIERGVREHPELSVGSQTEGIEVRSVGNSTALKETALIEAFNLKAAIEFQMKNYEAAQEALSDMPPRGEEELDPVSLHNTALMHMDSDPSPGFRKLNFLIQNPPFPPETFANLLMLYCKHQYYDLAADVLAENAHLTYQFLSADVYEFLDATLMVQTAPAEAYRKFDDLSKKHIDALRALTKNIQDARLQRDNELIKNALKRYDDALERYIPVLMAQARIYWDMEHWPMVEKIFRQSAEFCSEHETWKLNVAHVFFLQETKFKEAIRYYEPVVKRQEQNILSVPAIVLANLCVANIMTSQNEEAEELMRLVEKAEERGDPDKPAFHLCIINLVIGTLYCAKGNFEFGIGRVLKSLEPYPRKLGTDTWFYAKRTILALAETLAKHMIMLKDATFHEILTFLDAIDQCGKSIPTKVQDHPDRPVDTARCNVSFEARLLKKMFIKLRD